MGKSLQIHGSCGKKIAKATGTLDPEKAYVLGLLHDIGRREGVHHMRHIIDGYNYAINLSYEQVAKISMTHSFPLKNINAVFGEWDCTREEFLFVEKYISEVKFDDYDKLIQLCDSLALPEGFCIIEKRCIDVAMRYDVNEYTVPK
ncbi:HD domain-containing protein [Kosmotoga pacifica]|uniref:HD domain-containing protein n=1 Tax=Kosmotoga pacifica TaxID=1330330 RepID=UPI000AFFD1A6|nr:HD domain-containing protein [Kosmotoga pacifica]